MEEAMNNLMNELKKLRIDINIIKENLIDEDTFLDEEDKKAIKDYEKEKKEGLLISFEQLKKELENDL